MKPIILRCLFLAMIFTSCIKEPQTIAIKVTDITLNISSLEVIEGESANLIATVSPKNADNQNVIWSSSNGSVASVSNGVILALAAGSTTITAKSDDGGFTASCSVSVISKHIDVVSISLSNNDLSLIEGDSIDLTATVKPDNATDKSVKWSSSDSDIASVSNGHVIAHKEGMAIITAKAGDKEASCKVAVSQKVIPVESVSLNKTAIDIVEGSTETLSATVKPDNATNKNLTWSTSNSSVATVQNGKVTAVKAGTATITVKTEDGGKTAACQVTVKAKVIPVESASLNKTAIEIVEGSTETLTATVKPDNATNKNVTWSTSNSSVATVQNGKITAIKAGIATITVITEDGGKTATCLVTVKAKVIPVESVSINESSLILTEGDSERLLATVLPENATDKTVTWSSSDTSIATVDKDGLVVAVKAGNAIITVTTYDGRHIDQCPIIVNEKPIPSFFTLGKCVVSGITPLDATISCDFSSESDIIGVAWKAMLCFSTNDKPMINDQICDFGPTLGQLSGNFKDLLPNTRYYCRPALYYGGSYYYGETISLITPNLPTSGFVDLGLSVKWSACNIGASSPKESGDYFAWGETTTKDLSTFTRENYKYYDNEGKVYITIGDDISGTKYDAVTAELGEGYRMPTKKETDELVTKCRWKNASFRGAEGFLVTGVNDNYIFIVTVRCTETSSGKLASSQFWISTLSPSYNYYPNDAAYYLNREYYLVEHTFRAKEVERHVGLPIRAVKD